MRNGSLTPRDDGSAKQTQVMLLGKRFAEDVVWLEPRLEPWLEPWLKRYLHTKRFTMVIGDSENMERFRCKVPTDRSRTVLTEPQSGYFADA